MNASSEPSAIDEATGSAREASDGYLAATIVLGRSGTAMMPMVHGKSGLGQIAPRNVQDVVAF